MNSVKRVFGIDTGSAILGWSVIDYINNQFKVIDYGDVRTPANTRPEYRLKLLYEALLLLLNKYNPTEMAVESLFFNKNVTTAMEVSQARGIILLAGEMKGVKVFSYTPSQVKVAVTGYGKSEKKQVQSMVTNILKLKEIPKVDDTADALAIAICHCHSDSSK